MHNLFLVISNCKRQNISAHKDGTNVMAQTNNELKFTNFEKLITRLIFDENANMCRHCKTNLKYFRKIYKNKNHSFKKSTMSRFLHNRKKIFSYKTL